MFRPALVLALALLQTPAAAPRFDSPRAWDPLRAVLALTLVRWHGHASDWASAGAALGMPRSKARGWARHAYAARWELKAQLLEATETLQTVLDQQPHRATWKVRPTLDGHGLAALCAAQQPRCRLDDPDSPWCPCTSTPRRRL